MGGVSSLLSYCECRLPCVPQCDLAPQGCKQCARARLACHGYRNPRDLAFRDESRATERKVLARQAAVAPEGLGLAWEVYSRHIFFGGFLDGLSSGREGLPQLYAASSTTQPLSACVDAVSLAFTACQHRDSLLMRRANEKYVVAVQQLNLSLYKFSAATSDDTLQSAVLLDMYEKMVNRNPHCHASWMGHIRGAMSLVRTRMERHNLSLLASQLARRAVIAMTISCGAAGIPVPDAVIAIRSELDNTTDLDVKWQLTALLIDSVNLRARLHGPGLVLQASTAKAARIIESQLRDLEKALPPSWKPRRIHIAENTPCIAERYYDDYPDHFVTQTWNAIRIIRLEMISIALNHSSTDISQNSCSLLIDEIVQSICASVPRTLLPGALPRSHQFFSPLQTQQLCAFLAPLCLAAQLSKDTFVRAWIVRCLHHMAIAGRMERVKDIAEALTMGREVSHWFIYTMVGCYTMAG